MNEELLIGKFNNATELYESSPLFKACFETLLRGGDVYGLLEEVITMYEASCKEYTNLLVNGPTPQIIVTTQDRFDEIKNNKF